MKKIFQGVKRFLVALVSNINALCLTLQSLLVIYVIGGVAICCSFCQGQEQELVRTMWDEYVEITKSFGLNLTHNQLVIGAIFLCAVFADLVGPVFEWCRSVISECKSKAATQWRADFATEANRIAKQHCKMLYSRIVLLIVVFWYVGTLF